MQLLLLDSYFKAPRMLESQHQYVKIYIPTVQQTNVLSETGSVLAANATQAYAEENRLAKTLARKTLRIQCRVGG